MKKILVLAATMIVAEGAYAGIRGYDGQLSEGIRRTGRISQPEVPSLAESLVDQWNRDPDETPARRMSRLYMAGKQYDKNKLEPKQPPQQDDTYGSTFVFLSNKFDHDVLKKIKKLKDKQGMSLDIYIKESDTKLVARDFTNMLNDRAKEIEKKGKYATKADLSRGFFAFKMRPDIGDTTARVLKLEEYPSIVYVAPTGEKRQYPFTNDGFRRFEAKFKRVEKAVATGAMKSWTETFLARMGQ